MSRASVANEVAYERMRQDAKWGEQNHPDGTGPTDQNLADARNAKNATDWAAKRDVCTWRLILAEEVAEAFAEADPVALRTELIQVAAVATQWVEAIDRRTQSSDPSTTDHTDGGL